MDSVQTRPVGCWWLWWFMDERRGDEIIGSDCDRDTVAELQEVIKGSNSMRGRRRRRYIVFTLECLESGNRYFKGQASKVFFFQYRQALARHTSGKLLFSLRSRKPPCFPFFYSINSILDSISLIIKYYPTQDG